MPASIKFAGGGTPRIGRYDLIAEIASGGMATVYLGRLSGVGGFQRNVAIKCLHPHLAKNLEFVEMFLDEARLAALIHHPNVVSIHEVGEGEQGFYLVMDYVEGDTLATLLSRSSSRGAVIPTGVAIRIVVDMLWGLHAAHDLKDARGRVVGLVHRDVSPQNILVGTDGITRITDFGVAHAATRLSATRVGQLKGKLAYMAPEHAQGEEQLDRRADVFSAGVVLWEALAQRRLFKAANEAATLTRVLTEPVLSPAQHNPALPAAVAEVCLRALEREPAARFASCAEFAEALTQAATSHACLASAREVAEYVETLVGSEVESQRSAVREWLEARERQPASARPPPRSSRAPGAPPRRPPPLRWTGETSSTLHAPDSGWSVPPSQRPSSIGRIPPSGRALGSERPPAVEVVSISPLDASVAPVLRPPPGPPQPAVHPAPALPPPALDSAPSAPVSVVDGPWLPPAPPLGPGAFDTAQGFARAMHPPWYRRRGIRWLGVAAALLVGFGVTWVLTTEPTEPAGAEAVIGSVHPTSVASAGGAVSGAGAAGSLAPPAASTAASNPEADDPSGQPAQPDEDEPGADDPSGQPEHPVADEAVAAPRPAPRPRARPSFRRSSPPAAPARQPRSSPSRTKRALPDLENPYQ